MDDTQPLQAGGYIGRGGRLDPWRVRGRDALGTSNTAGVAPVGATLRVSSTLAIKRVIDVVAACTLFVVSAPVMLIVAALIKWEDGGPVIFSQARVGRFGLPFTLNKFRSMRVDAEAETGPMWAQTNDPRVTRVGRWLRALRIDEIPQLWNVLKGEMSFVGPRPERPEFTAILGPAIPGYDLRHTVRPGITGWAQINCRPASTMEDARRKLRYDLYYLEHGSLWMDLWIMLRTITIVLAGWRDR